MCESNLGRWDPITPAGAADVLSGLQCPWWIAGGWAIDLHVGRQTRDHDDIDVLILREDQLALQRQLAGWDLQPPTLPASFGRGARGRCCRQLCVTSGVRRTPTSMWCLQLMIDDAKAGVWTYRRDARVRRPVAENCTGAPQMPHQRVLAPEVQLLHKSRRPRPKDEADLLAVRPHLDLGQKRWLEAALSLVSAWTPVARIPLTTDDDPDGPPVSPRVAVSGTRKPPVDKHFRVQGACRWSRLGWVHGGDLLRGGLGGGGRRLRRCCGG